MTLPSQIVAGFSRWLDTVASTVVAWLGWFASPRAVTLIEAANGELVLQTGKGASADSTGERLRIADGRIVGAPSAGMAAALRGSRAELTLRPGRFLFRPLELPDRAAEFLAGIIRAQIDRLTPWAPADAVFGWSKPVEAGNDRIALTVAATARALVAPYVQALAELGAQAVTISTVLPESPAGAVPIKVLEERAHSVDVRRVRRMLVILLTIASLAAAGAVGAAAIVGSNLDAQQDELSRRIARHRDATRTATNAPADAATAGRRALEKRKHEAPASVMVLETLSQILPDHTYVTELRVEADKLRVVGVTQNAPSLIGLIEQSGRFTRATFFAPTTRSPSDPGERFHIEAQIEPVFSPRS